MNPSQNGANDPDRPADPPSPTALESSVELLKLARAGDRIALQRLYDRYLPRLQRWAHGRLPGAARSLLETNDIVQEVLARCVQRLHSVKDGAFHSYLRVALNNRLCDEARRARNAPDFAEMPDDLRAAGPTPIEAALGSERLARYEAALARMRPEDRELIFARIEMGCSFEEMAQLLGKPSANAARMAVTRAVEKLIVEISHDD